MAPLSSRAINVWLVAVSLCLVLCHGVQQRGYPRDGYAYGPQVSMNDLSQLQLPSQPVSNGMGAQDFPQFQQQFMQQQMQPMQPQVQAMQQLPPLMQQQPMQQQPMQQQPMQQQPMQQQPMQQQPMQGQNDQSAFDFSSLPQFQEVFSQPMNQPAVQKQVQNQALPMPHPSQAQTSFLASQTSVSNAQTDASRTAAASLTASQPNSAAEDRAQSEASLEERQQAVVSRVAMLQKALNSVRLEATDANAASRDDAVAATLIDSQGPAAQSPADFIEQQFDGPLRGKSYLVVPGQQQPDELDEALNKVKENILDKANQMKKEKAWIKEVQNVVVVLNTKTKKVGDNIETLHRDLLELLKKMRKIKNVKLQRLLEDQLQKATADLQLLQDELTKVHQRQQGFEKSKESLARTISDIEAQLKQLRGETGSSTPSSSDKPRLDADALLEESVRLVPGGAEALDNINSRINKLNVAAASNNDPALLLPNLTIPPVPEI